MKEQEIDIIKEISIRGRFAYCLSCFEIIIHNLDLRIPELKILLEKFWEITNSEKIGWWQNLLIENNPKVIIEDFELFQKGKITFDEIGFTTITNKNEFISRVAFLNKLPNPVQELLDKLTEIANRNLFAGSGEFSMSTLEPTVEFIEIIDSNFDFERPKFEIVKFSKFSENNGWGNRFLKSKLSNNSKP